MDCRFVIIEGLIGAGKSTLVSYLKDLPFEDYIFVKEPYELFRQFGSFDTFALLSEDPQKYASFIQLHIVRSLRQFYAKLTADCRRQTRRKTYVCERFISSPLVFTRALCERGYISEFAREILLDLSTEYIGEVGITPTHVFYLNTSLATCLDRIKNRGRTAEISFVDKEYLQNLSDAYNIYMYNLEGVCVKKSQSEDNLSELAQEFLEFIR